MLEAALSRVRRFRFSGEPRPILPSLHDESPWIFAAILATAAPHAIHLPLWLSLLGGALLAWRFQCWKDRRYPPRGAPIFFALLGIVGIAVEYRAFFGRDPGVAFLFLFIILKSLEMRNRHDTIFILMLGFFLLLTHYFYSQSIFTGLWLLAAIWLLIAALHRLYGGGASPRRIYRNAARLLAQSIPFMLLFFVLFPRVQGPLWGLPRDAHAGLSGLSDTLSPGSLDDLIQSSEIAFRVKFQGAVPEKSELYWRGPVFTHYDGKTWRAPPFYMQGRAQLPAARPGQTTYRYVTTLEPHNLRWILPLDLPVSIPPNSFLTAHFETVTRERVTARTQYAFGSVPDDTIAADKNPLILREALALPRGTNPRARAFSADLEQRFGPSPAKISSAALLHFREEAFRYTLSPPILPDRNPIDHFLFETKSGFCEHYAAAYVFIMRSAGVPARVVAGYQGGEINPIDDYLVVRQSDAHAWAEIWLDGKGWQRVDPTAYIAPSRIEQGIRAALPNEALPALIRLDSTFLRDLRNRWEAANNAWNQWVLGYTPQRQKEVLSRMGFNEPDWQKMLAALGMLCVAALLVVAFATFGQRRVETPAQAAWRRFCGQLARVGLPRQDWEGPLAFAERVGNARPRLAALAREAALCYARLHYGTGGPELLERLKRCVNGLRALTGRPGFIRSKPDDTARRARL